MTVSHKTESPRFHFILPNGAEYGGVCQQSQHSGGRKTSIILKSTLSILGVQSQPERHSMTLSQKRINHSYKKKKKKKQTSNLPNGERRVTILQCLHSFSISVLMIRTVYLTQLGRNTVEDTV